MTSLPIRSNNDAKMNIAYFAVELVKFPSCREPIELPVGSELAEGNEGGSSKSLDVGSRPSSLLIFTAVTAESEPPFSSVTVSLNVRISLCFSILGVTNFALALFTPSNWQLQQ